MRGILLFGVFLIIIGCGGSLPDEQRRALKEEMENRRIKRVSEEQIFEKAFEMGRAYMKQLNANNMDSLAQANDVKILYADSISSSLTTEQKSVLEAYKFSSNTSDLIDNVQKSGDTILYSYPEKNEENTLEGVWFISIPKKKIVLAI